MLIIPEFATVADAQTACSQLFPYRQLTLFPLEEGLAQRLIRIDGKPYWSTYHGGQQLRVISCFDRRFETIVKLIKEAEFDVEFHFDGYAEPGYDEPDCGVIATADWNNKTYYDREQQKHITTDETPSRILKILEKMGVECEWDDQWIECQDCYKLLRTDADCMSWRPSYAMGNGWVLCQECLSQDPTDYLDDQRGTKEGVNVSFDLSDHGYLQIYETSWQSDREHATKVLRQREIEDFLWNNGGELWLPADKYTGRKQEILAAIETREMELGDYLSDLQDALDSYSADCA